MNTKFSSKRPLTRKEEAEVQKMIASDHDAPEATDEQLAQAKPFAAAFPELAESIKRSRGRPSVDNPRQQISIRLDPEVIDGFKATGKGWQSKINDALEARLRKLAGLRSHRNTPSYLFKVSADSEVFSSASPEFRESAEAAFREAIQETRSKDYLEIYALVPGVGSVTTDMMAEALSEWEAGQP